MEQVGDGGLRAKQSLQAEKEKHLFSKACTVQTKIFLTQQTLFIAGNQFIKSRNGRNGAPLSPLVMPIATFAAMLYSGTRSFPSICPHTSPKTCTNLFTALPLSPVLTL